MAETVFELSYLTIRRMAAVRAAKTAILYRLATDFRRDLEQEALLELWTKRTAYDARRGTWRTFSEHVVANRLASLMRAQGDYLMEEPLHKFPWLAAPTVRGDLRADISLILARMSTFDRKMATYLTDYSAIETSRKLGYLAPRYTVRSNVSEKLSRRLAYPRGW